MDATLVQIGTTNRCNERCTFCPNPTMSRSKGVMSWDTFTSIIDNEPSPIYDLCLFGEPLLDPMLCKRIAYIKSVRPGSEVYFHTNGILLKPSVVDALVEAGLSRIVVSIYGFNDGTHQGMQPVGPWDLLVSNVTYSCSKLNTMVVGAHMEFPIELKSRSFWESLGATTHYNYMTDYGDSQSGPIGTPQQRCSIALGFKTFDYDGSMVMCCNDFEAKTTFGDCNSQTWDEASKSRTPVPEFCNSCSMLGELQAHLGLAGEVRDAS